MPITKSAIKAMRQSVKRRIVNLKTKDKYRDALKAFRKLVLGGKKKEAFEAMKKAASAIDKAVKKHQVHRNKSARLKSRMAKALARLKD